MLSRMSSRRAFVLIALAAVIIAVAFLFEWNWLKHPFESYLGARIGRPVTIDGDLKVELSWQPLISAESFSVRNANWGSESLMLIARRVDMRVDLLSLFKLRTVLPELAFTEPELLLERNADGARNWDLPAAINPPRIDRLVVDDGSARYFDPSTGTDVVLAIDSEEGDDDTPVQFHGGGVVRRDPFTVEGGAGRLMALAEDAKPYRLTLQVTSGATTAAFDGTVLPAQVDNIDGELSLRGRDMSELYPIIPVPFLWTPAYQLKGRLTHSAKLWTLRGFKGKVGDSDVAGDFVLDVGHERPSIDATIVSQQLDVKDLGGLVGIPPANQPAAQRSPEQSRETVRRASSQRVLPTRPYDLARLRSIDGTVRFRGKQFRATQLPLDDMKMTMVIDHGVIRLQPLDFGVASGRVSSTVTMDAREDVMKTTGDVTLSKLEVKELVPKLTPPQGSAGKVDGRVRFATRGNSVADMMAAGNGQMALTATGGSMSELNVVLTNLDLANAIPLLFRDRNSPLRCVVAHFEANHGQLDAKSLVIDTAAERIQGAGNIDLANEKLALTLNAASKKPSLIALRGPIVVDGSFRAPRVHALSAQVAVRVGAAAALATVSPPAALVPLIDLGGAKDADCDALMQEAETSVEKSPAPS
jgi:uncharacterized protein involved in outer membrane biogenesis